MDCDVTSDRDGSSGTVLGVGSLRVREAVRLLLRLFADVSTATLDKENGTTPARRAISYSPSCQCIASAARQGIAISSANLAHMSGLNLCEPW